MTKRGTHFLVVGIVVIAAVMGSSSGAVAQPSGALVNHVQGREHYVMRDGLRIYQWEKYGENQEGTFARNGKVALLVHGGTPSGRSLYDLQIRDYSLMDFLAQNLCSGFGIPAECLLPPQLPPRIPRGEKQERDPEQQHGAIFHHEQRHTDYEIHD